jgi:uncharacterized protein YcbX
MLTVSQLFIYPIKSMRGISVQSAIVTDRGFQNDRRWMLVDEKNNFLTLRELPKMAMLIPSLNSGGIRIKSIEYPIDELEILFDDYLPEFEKVTIWNATVDAARMGDEVDKWFTEVLGRRCKLFYMPESSMRPVDTTSGFHPEGKFTSFADAYPFMMLGEASLNDLNSRMEEPISIRRFRPNIVFSGGSPFQEDEIEGFTINEVNFTGLEKCTRCMIPNVDPETGIFSKNREPLKTLLTYRLTGTKIEFGRNVVHSGTGIVNVGDEISLV